MNINFKLKHGKIYLYLINKEKKFFFIIFLLNFIEIKIKLLN